MTAQAMAAAAHHSEARAGKQQRAEGRDGGQLSGRQLQKKRRTHSDMEVSKLVTR